MSDLDIDQYNQKVRAWQEAVFSQFKNNISSIGIKGKQELLKHTRNPGKIQERIKQEGILLQKIKKGKLGREGGEIVSIGFKFPRHGVFEAYGVRNRHPISNPKNAKDWWSNPLRINVPVLCQVICDYKADYLVKAAVRNFDKGLTL